MSKGKIGIVVDPNDSLFWDLQIDYLQESGWEVELLIHQSWSQPTASSELPIGAEAFDVLVVYAMGSRNWWAEALTALNKPTVYISTFGRPNLDIKNVRHLDGFYRLPQLLLAVEEVFAA